MMIEPTKLAPATHPSSNFEMNNGIEPIPLFSPMMAALDHVDQRFGTNCSNDNGYPSVTAQKISKQINSSMLMNANKHQERFESYDNSSRYMQCLPRVIPQSSTIHPAPNTKKVGVEIDSTINSSDQVNVNLEAAAAVAAARAAAAAHQHKQQAANIQKSSSSSRSGHPAKFPNTYRLSEFDIMCGRHKKALHHEGNRKFRALISTFLPRYFQYSGRVDRAILALDIMEAVGKSGGYFLKQNRDSGEWVELNEKEKRNKVGHALRDAAGFSQGTTFKTALMKQKQKQEMQQQQEERDHASRRRARRDDVSSTQRQQQEDELSDEELSTILGDETETIPLFNMLTTAIAVTSNYEQQLRRQQQQQQQPMQYVNMTSQQTTTAPATAVSGPSFNNSDLLLEDLSDFEF